MDKNNDIIPTNIAANAYDEILLYEGQTEMKFVIMRESLKNINEVMKFETRNASVNAVTFEKNSDPVAYNDIKFSGLYPGDWERSEFISKKHLQSIGGDVKITLNIEAGLYGNKSEAYYKIKPQSENFEDINVSAFNYAPGSDLWYDFYTKGSKTFVFTISEDEIEKLGSRGLGFQVHNVIITSAVLEKA